MRPVRAESRRRVDARGPEVVLSMTRMHRALGQGPGRFLVLLALAALGPGIFPRGAAAETHQHGAAPEASPGPVLSPPPVLSPDLVVDRAARRITLEAVAQPGAFEASLPPDHQYHALVHREGSAAGKALFLTAVPDTTIARALRELGAEDGGGVPMAAWNLRWVPLVPQPATRVQGTPLEIAVTWNAGAGEVTLPMGDLLQDPGGRGTSFRFGGNEDQNHHWDSGCIVCLFSCPGGVVSNAAYTIRDHQRGVTRFLPGDRMPPEGTVVRISFTLSMDDP